MDQQRHLGLLSLRSSTEATPDKLYLAHLMDRIITGPVSVSGSSLDLTKLVLTEDNDNLIRRSIPAGQAGTFGVTWTPPTPGTYQIYAVATDKNSNNLVQSEPIIITSTSGTGQAPLVKMDELSSPMMYSGTAQNISLSATATDADGYVQQVAFYVNGDLVGTDTSSPYAAGYDINASGMYEVYAVASDDDGNDITSTVQHILVLEGIDVVEPLSLSSPDGTYLGGIAEITALYKSPTENYDSSIQAHVYIDSEYAGTATKLLRFEPAPGDEDPGIAFTEDLATETSEASINRYCQRGDRKYV